MKASNIAVKETHTLHVKDAAGEPMYELGPDGVPDESKPVEIDIYGPGSKQYRKAKSDQQNRMVTLVKKGTKQSVEAKAQNDAAFLADITADMRYLEEDDADGKPLRGRALYVAIYTRADIGFIADQVHAFAHDWANFSRASSTT